MTARDLGTSTADSGQAADGDDVASAYSIRPLADGDEGSLLVSFPAAFGKDRSLAAWRWAFRSNPAGTRVFVAVHRGSVVAQYAAWPVRTWIDGASTTFCQVVDSMVHPEHRAGLKRPGLFVRVGEAFFAAYGGRDVDGEARLCPVFYGWPARANWRIGERHLGYERVQSQLILARACSAAIAPPSEVVHIARFGDEARWLYERCVDEWGASTVRDARYLNWRYVDRPAGDYLRLAVREPAGALRGLCIARIGDFAGERVALVADWLVPAGESGVGLALLAALDAAAAEAGAGSIALMIPGWSPWFGRLQGYGFSVRPTAYDLVARSFDRRIDAGFLRERWWYQLGDSDLV